MKAKDPRWVLLSEDGGFSQVGRHNPPTEEEISFFEEQFRTLGRAGWLGVMSQSLHDEGEPTFMLVREINDPRTLSFEEATARLVAENARRYADQG